MLKKIFISAILLIAVLSFVVSLLGGKNSYGTEKIPVPKGDRVAVIDIQGAIESGADGTAIFAEATGATSGRIMQELRQAATDKSVKAVLLRINSPGGSVTAAEEIAREIERFKTTSNKPIVATMGDTGASAAYYIAADCDKIYANASTLTGSIGVYMGTKNLEELYKKLGVSDVMIKSGIHKDIMSTARPMTPEEREILQTMVNEMYEEFLTVVSTGRKIPMDKVRALADGRVYTGKQAKALGLVDEIGNYYDALDATGALVGIKGTPEVVEYGSVKNWKTWFSSKIAEQVTGKIMEAIEAQGGASRMMSPRAEG